MTKPKSPFLAQLQKKYPHHHGMDEQIELQRLTSASREQFTDEDLARCRCCSSNCGSCKYEGDICLDSVNCVLGIVVCFLCPENPEVARQRQRQRRGNLPRRRQEQEFEEQDSCSFHFFLKVFRSRPLLVWFQRVPSARMKHCSF